MAEEEGFEPPVPFDTAVFKTAAFNHSATPPQKIDPIFVLLQHLVPCFKQEDCVKQSGAERWPSG